MCRDTIVPSEDQFVCKVCREGTMCGPCTKEYLKVCWNQNQIGICPICRKSFPISYHGEYFFGEVVLSCDDYDDDLIRDGEWYFVYDILFTMEMRLVQFGMYLSLVFLTLMTVVCFATYFWWLLLEHFSIKRTSMCAPYVPQDL